MASRVDRAAYGWVAFGAGASLALGVLGGITTTAELTRQRGPATPDRSASRPAGGVINTHVGGASPPPCTPGLMVELAPPRSAELPRSQRSRTWFASN